MPAPTALPKSPSGIRGLDEITGGGLPSARPTLVCGGAGCGKTLFAVQFLVKGALEHGEPGVFISFEETSEEIAQNVASLGWDVTALQSAGLLAMDHVSFGTDDIHETGAFDLDGLFIRIGAAIDSVGAKRVVLDTLEVLFGVLSDQRTLRSELRRLFGWLKDRGVTAVITAERGEGSMTRYGLEEYVSDCVIVLDHRVTEQLSTRRMRVVKYRGTAHVADEVPFLIDETGFRAVPITSLSLEHSASDERLSTGVPRLDAMLDGRGYFRGSSILISGTPGSGKTALAASFAGAVCAGGERVLYLAFEESPAQLMRNTLSVGIDLSRHVGAGRLKIVATRPSSTGLEAHLASILADVERVDPAVVVIDPLSAFADDSREREAMFARLVDLLKSRGTTALCTSLTDAGASQTSLGISSIIDTWISLTSVEHAGERNRGLTIVKSRGMAHSNQTREFHLTSSGIQLRDVYTGASCVLMGTARQAQEAADAASLAMREARLESTRRQIGRLEETLSARITSLTAESQAAIEQLALDVRAEEGALERLASAEAAMGASRGVDA